MKISKTEKEQKFSPVEIKIVIENEDELDAIKAMCMYDLSIPDLVSSRDTSRTNTNVNIVKKFLRYLNGVL